MWYNCHRHCYGDHSLHSALLEYQCWAGMCVGLNCGNVVTFSLYHPLPNAYVLFPTRIHVGDLINSPSSCQRRTTVRSTSQRLRNCSNRMARSSLSLAHFSHRYSRSQKNGDASVPFRPVQTPLRSSCQPFRFRSVCARA